MENNEGTGGIMVVYVDTHLLPVPAYEGCRQRTSSWRAWAALTVSCAGPTLASQLQCGSLYETQCSTVNSQEHCNNSCCPTCHISRLKSNFLLEILYKAAQIHTM